MESPLALAAAVVATGFFLELAIDHIRRPRPHVAAWSAAMFMYGAATWALYLGLVDGWSDVEFRVFYWFGAVLNVVFLALGAVYLVLGSRVGGVLLVVFSAFGAGSGAVTFGTRLLAALPDSGVPAGSDLFVAPSEGIASPRLWAIVGNGVGSILIVGLALYAAWRFWRSNRRLATGNLLIVVGTVAPVLGGSLTAFGEGGGLAASLLAGAALLWLGYRIATAARPSAASPVRA